MQSKEELIINLTGERLPNLGRSVTYDVELSHSSRGYRYTMKIKDAEFPDKIIPAI